jgi:hypothetical protein
MYCRVVKYMLPDVSAVRTASITRAMIIEAVRTSETSVNIYLTTRQYIPEISELHTRRRENLKSQVRTILLTWSWPPPSKHIIYSPFMIISQSALHKLCFRYSSIIASSQNHISLHPVRCYPRLTAEKASCLLLTIWSPVVPMCTKNLAVL